MCLTPSQAQIAVNKLQEVLSEITLTPFIDVAVEMEHESLDSSLFSVCFSGWPTNTSISREYANLTSWTDLYTREAEFAENLDVLFPGWRENFNDYLLGIEKISLRHIFVDTDELKERMLSALKLYLASHRNTFKAGLQSPDKEVERFGNSYQRSALMNSNEKIRSWCPKLCAQNKSGAVDLITAQGTLEQLLPTKSFAKIIDAVCEIAE